MLELTPPRYNNTYGTKRANSTRTEVKKKNAHTVTPWKTHIWAAGVTYVCVHCAHMYSSEKITRVLKKKSTEVCLCDIQSTRKCTAHITKIVSKENMRKTHVYPYNYQDMHFTYINTIHEHIYSTYKN